MATGTSTTEGKKMRGVNSDENVGSGWKSPIKLQSPVAHTKTIYLHQWWLMWPEGGDGIAVGGFAFRREGVETYFSSATIKERHDNTTLESSDGFTIFISGLIDRSVTEENGFPSEVYSHFLTGFPLNWDDFASQRALVVSPDNLSSFQNMSFLQKRDLLLLDHGLYEEDVNKVIFGDLFEKLKPAPASSMDDNTCDCDLPRTGKSKELQEEGKYKSTSFNVNGVRTRRMTKMENAAKR